jgi:hypothetical protein
MKVIEAWVWKERTLYVREVLKGIRSFVGFIFGL